MDLFPIAAICHGTARLAQRVVAFLVARFSRVASEELITDDTAHRDELWQFYKSALAIRLELARAVG